jgi:hypothetical protein
MFPVECAMCDGYASADVVSFIESLGDISNIFFPIRMISIDFFALRCIGFFRSLMY